MKSDLNPWMMICRSPSPAGPSSTAHRIACLVYTYCTGSGEALIPVQSLNLRSLIGLISHPPPQLASLDSDILNAPEEIQRIRDSGIEFITSKVGYVTSPRQIP